MCNALQISKKTSIYFFSSACLLIILQAVQTAFCQYRWMFIGCSFFITLILYIGAVGGSLLVLLLLSYITALLGFLQGLYPSLYVALMFATSNALTISIFMANINRSILLGIIFSAALKAGYLALLSATGVFSTLADMAAWNCFFTYRLFGINQLFISLAAGLCSSPILFFMHFSYKEMPERF